MSACRDILIWWQRNKDKVHNFLKDPIELVKKEGNLMMANGTTLGADNGIAVATNLAIMEDKSLVTRGRS